jgi:hypothetical protein
MGELSRVPLGCLSSELRLWGWVSQQSLHLGNVSAHTTPTPKRTPNTKTRRRYCAQDCRHHRQTPPSPNVQPHYAPGLFLGHQLALQVVLLGLQARPALLVLHLSQHVCLLGLQQLGLLSTLCSLSLFHGPYTGPQHLCT